MGWLWSSSYSRKSSNSQHLFRAFFTGSGAVGDEFLAGIDGDAWRSGCLAGGGEAGGDVSVGSGGGGGVVNGGCVGVIGGFLEALAAGQLADSGALEHVVAALRRWLRRRGF
jgi:hypothetical protein